jgi:predicted MFS family arabinose efflux permease
VSTLDVLRAPQAARVLLGSLVGRLPLGAAPLALLVFARESMTLAASALLVAAYTAGIALGGPALARVADRWRQPPVLWLSAIASTLGFVLVALGPPVPVAVGAAALAGLGAPPFEACLRVLWRDLLPAAAVPAAYTLDIATQELIFIVGPLTTVGAVALFGPAAGLLSAALFQFAGTVGFATTAAVVRWRGEPAHHHWLGPLRSGPLRVVLAAIVLIGLGIGSVVVAATAYAEVRASTSAAGWLISAQAVGALTGGLVYTRIAAGGPGRWRLPWIATAMTVSYLPLLLLPDVGPMLGLLFLSGLGLPVLLTVGFLTVDRVAPPGTAAEAFAWVGTAFAVGSAAGSALTGVVLDASGSLRVGFLVAPVAIALAAATLSLLPPSR